MLNFLTIRDFVIVAQFELQFSAGFTALTGETGAGKSILLDALSLALGERGDATMVRAGCERADISAEFDLRDLPELRTWLREHELADDDDICLLRRVLDNSGRSRGFINGRSATLQQMREAGAHLLDIHGQHAHQSLLKSDEQRALLDGYAGLTGQTEQVAAHFRHWQTVQRRYRELTQNASAVAAERELLIFQRNELSALDCQQPNWGEQWAATQAEYARLSHSASLLETAQFGVEVLSEAETACLPQLATLIARVQTGLSFDVALTDSLQMLASAQAELQEAVYALRHYQRRVEADPQQLNQLERRIQAVVDTARKYRIAPEALPQKWNEVSARLAELGEAADAGELQQQEQVAQTAYLDAARQLSRARTAAAGKLGAEISAAMQGLAMQGGRFAVALLPQTEGSAQGLETIEFQVAANPGTPLRALAKTASGGELSRISLAIQVVLSDLARVPTLIFDEVDSGIGGGVAEIVGQLLKRLGARHQVLCVTHLPQVAAAADAQWQVSKHTTDGATFSRITPLTASQRIEEIARMLGGLEITPTTRQHAAEMLGQ